MSNNFKSGAAASVGTTDTQVYITPAGKKSIIIELDVANTSNNAIQVYVGVGTASAIAYYIVKGATIPVGDSLQVVSGQKIVLDGSVTQQKVFVRSSAATSADVLVSVLEDVS